MRRRTFLHAASATALASCIHARPIAPASPIRAVAFDLFTIFDPRGVDRRTAAVVPGTDAAAFTATWKSRLFEYSWLRAAAGRYVPFDRLVRDALSYAERAHAISLAPAAREELATAFTRLEPWPDARDVLHHLRASGLRLATLANFSPPMIAALLARSDLASVFDHPLSTDAARSYKPDPRAYAVAEPALGLPRSQIAFAAFGNWDAAGAAWFGFPTFWVDRLGVPAEELGAPSVASGSDLVALETWLGRDHRLANENG